MNGRTAVLEGQVAPVVRRLLTLLFLAPSLILLSSCDADPLGPEPFLTTGTVEFLASEDCWAIESNGRLYEPISLPEVHRKEGARIRFEGVIRREVEGRCEIGPVVEIHWIIQLPQSD